MAAPIQCGLCLANLAPHAFAAHQRRLHYINTNEQWQCSKCQGLGATFADSLVHLLLDGHLSSGISTNTSVRSQLTISATERKPAKKKLVSKKPKMLNDDDAEWVEELADEVSSIDTYPDGQDSEYADPDEQNETFRAPTDFKTDFDGISDELTATEDLSIVSRVNIDGADSKHDINAKITASKNHAVKKRGRSSKGKTYTTRRCDCSKCGAELKLVNNRSLHMIEHVKACFDIRPYGCTGCQFTASRKSNLYPHIKIKHKKMGVEVKVVDKENNEVAVRKGLNRCFPDENVPFTGIH